MTNHIGPSQARALRFIASNPGTSILNVDSHVRTARGGHKHMYATVHRLLKRGLVKNVAPKGSQKYALELTMAAGKFLVAR